MSQLRTDAEKLRDGDAVPGTPYCIVVEVKRSKDFNTGYAQVLAEMLAMFRLNADQKVGWDWGGGGGGGGGKCSLINY